VPEQRLYESAALAVVLHVGHSAHVWHGILRRALDKRCAAQTNQYNCMRNSEHDGSKLIKR
jgi:hypothetical protein